MRFLELSFADPTRLWLLLIVPALVVAYLVLQARRRRYTLRFTNLALLDQVAPRRPAWRRHLALVFALATIALLVTAFAQPQREVEVARERATIVVAVDVSLSMESDDVPPTRLEAAQGAARSFIEDLPPTFNVSLVSFAGTAQILVPPTQDRQAIYRAIDGLELAPSTAIGEALLTSLEALKQVPVEGSDSDSGESGEEVPARIALMADGHQNVGRPVEDGIAAAQEANVPVYTVAFGTPYGTVDIEGDLTPVPVDEATMRRIAEQTDGQTYTAETGEELAEVYNDIGSSVGYVTEEQEVTAEWVGYALVSALLAAMASLVFFGRLP